MTRQGMSYLTLDRARTEGETQGFIKILTVPKKDKILGVTIVGYQASELIGEFVFAMTHNLGLKKIIDAIHVYPTMFEANKLAANEWRKNHLPHKSITLGRRFLAWLSPHWSLIYLQGRTLSNSLLEIF